MTILDFLYSQLFVTLPKPTKDHSGETIIITGANTGLGLEAARHFARLNAETVILACRNTSKGQAAANSILESTKRAKSAVEVWPLDLSSYESVKAFAERAQGLKRLDAVIENAGIATEKWSFAEGEEQTVTVNVVSTFLLALLLLPKLRETGRKENVLPRLSFTTSEVHGWTGFSEGKADDIFEKLATQEGAKMAERYPVSKLLEVFYVRELAAHTAKNGDPDVVINMLNPGLCHSELSRDSGYFLEVLKFFLARSTECGSRTLVSAAEMGVESHGEYLSDCKVAQVAPLVTSEEGKGQQQKIWKELNGKLEKIQPGITENI